ncbi:MAG: hypothetical protein A4E72_01722 [Syntrophus sp. PtaU1.Bin208]|nr:MAG: hypothetical protein A4E72_01722 [Syntrophus sp. PtaU1.Bin208]
MKKQFVMSVAVITTLMFLGGGLSYAGNDTGKGNGTGKRDGSCQNLTTDNETLTV